MKKKTIIRLTAIVAIASIIAGFTLSLSDRRNQRKDKYIYSEQRHKH